METLTKPEYLNTDTTIDLNIGLIRCIKGYSHELPHKRLEAAVDLVDEIAGQLAPEDRRRLEGEDEQPL